MTNTWSSFIVLVKHRSVCSQRSVHKNKIVPGRYTDIDFDKSKDKTKVRPPYPIFSIDNSVRMVEEH